VLAPGVERWPVYLPDGDWVDAWTGERHAGPGVITARPRRHQAPAFVAARAWGDLRDVFA